MTCAIRPFLNPLFVNRGHLITYFCFICILMPLMVSRASSETAGGHWRLNDLYFTCLVFANTVARTAEFSVDFLGHSPRALGGHGLVAWCWRR